MNANAITAAALPRRRRRPRACAGWPSDAWVLAKRQFAHIRQIPEKLLDVTLQPLMFVLLFAFVFGGVIPSRAAAIPRISDRRHPRPDPRLRDDGPGDLDRDRPRRGHHRPLPLAADVRGRRILIGHLAAEFGATIAGGDDHGRRAA